MYYTSECGTLAPVEDPCLPWAPPALTSLSFPFPVPLIRTMESRIMIPLKISPLQ